MTTRATVLEAIRAAAGRVPDDREAQDLFRAFDLDGAEAAAFMAAYAGATGTDMTEWRWYFHHNAQRERLRRLVPVATTGRTLDRIPVSVDLLVTAAEAGAWPYVLYPAHRTQRRRPVLWVVGVLGLIAVASVLAGRV